jgi:hypothetical protein
MKNPFVLKDWTLSTAFMFLWIVFSVVYVGISVKNTVLMQIYGNGQQSGRDITVSQIVELSKKCEPIALNVGEVKVNLISTECLKKPADTNEKE